MVEIYYKYNRITIHPRNYKPYVYTTTSEHLASTHQFVAQWRAARFIDWANSIDESVVKYILQINESRNHPEQAYKSCLGILGFEKKVGKQRLINAYKRNDHIDFEQKSEQELPIHDNIRGKQYYN